MTKSDKTAMSDIKHCVVKYSKINRRDLDRLLSLVERQERALEKAKLQRDDALWNRFKLNPAYAEVLYTTDLSDIMDKEIKAILRGES